MPEHTGESGPDTPRVALVTAASRGMGAAIARRLATDGYRLGLLGRSEDVAALAEELGGPSVAFAIRGSVTEASDLARLVEGAVERWGRVDGVVCNTGHPPKGDLLAIADDDWHAGLDMVLLNVVRMARLTVPVMEAHGRGAFVNISTFGAVEPSLAFPVSSALRAGLGAFAKLFADRYGAAGLRMNNLLPGFVETYDIDEATRAQIPAGRSARVDEIAATAAFLLLDASSYVNGQSLRVDGGLTRST